MARIGKAKSAAAIFFFLFMQSIAMSDGMWKRHTIDDVSRGADGVRVADINGDGRLDVVTGWEEGGITRIYLYPGPEKVRDRWPAVTVGLTPSVEDAVFVDLDLDGDGDLDVLACEESEPDSNDKRKGLGVFWYENPLP